MVIFDFFRPLQVAYDFPDRKLCVDMAMSLIFYILIFYTINKKLQYITLITLHTSILYDTTKTMQRGATYHVILWHENFLWGQGHVTVNRPVISIIYIVAHICSSRSAQILVDRVNPH